MTDVLVRRAEIEVVEAAVEWVQAQLAGASPGCPADRRLRLAVYMLRKSRHVTGQFTPMRLDRTDPDVVELVEPDPS